MPIWLPFCDFIDFSYYCRNHSIYSFNYSTTDAESTSNKASSTWISCSCIPLFSPLRCPPILGTQMAESDESFCSRSFLRMMRMNHVWCSTLRNSPSIFFWKTASLTLSPSSFLSRSYFEPFQNYHANCRVLEMLAATDHWSWTSLIFCGCHYACSASAMFLIAADHYLCADYGLIYWD